MINNDKIAQKSALGPYSNRVLRPAPMGNTATCKSPGKILMMRHGKRKWTQKSKQRQKMEHQEKQGKYRAIFYFYFLFSNTHLLHVNLFCVRFLRLRGGEMGINDSILHFASRRAR